VGEEKKKKTGVKQWGGEETGKKGEKNTDQNTQRTR